MIKVVESLDEPGPSRSDTRCEILPPPAVVRRPFRLIESREECRSLYQGVALCCHSCSDGQHGRVDRRHRKVVYAVELPRC